MLTPQMVIFTGSMGLMEGKDVAQIRQKFSDVSATSHVSRETS
jgi:hypothetical protein